MMVWTIAISNKRKDTQENLGSPFTYGVFRKLLSSFFFFFFPFPLLSLPVLYSVRTRHEVGQDGFLQSGSTFFLKKTQDRSTIT
ncbi:hypothetical protein L873DRAFT_265450 [Choiromyces venosus 120613-1]|uniref:Uncharacterized protein n=1 Tax=Choiromyces venosus 120613-1 TaxID=1336337 RepID=A0A3N4J0N2_9PEZI|nr:hypothetical protein L873DRAFT_265450 [Choiromyces venosus 120613-1]